MIKGLFDSLKHGILDSQKIKACKTLINYFLGSYLDESLQDDQICLSDGKVICKGVHLNLNEINTLLTQQSIPFKVVVACIDQITVSLPWNSSANSSSTFELQKLEIELHPINRSNSMCPDDMLDSMISSMTRYDHSMDESFKDSLCTPQINMDTKATDDMAKIIDSLIANISITLKDTRIRIEYSPVGFSRGIGLEFSIKRLDISKGTAFDEEPPDPYYRESGQQSDNKSDTGSTFTDYFWPSGSKADSKQQQPHEKENFDQAEVVCKKLHFTDIAIHWDIFPQSSQNNMPESTLTEPLDSSGLSDVSDTPSSLPSIPLAQLSGPQTARVILRPTGSPRCRVELSLSPLHVFLCPDQVHWLRLVGLEGDHQDVQSGRVPVPSQPPAKSSEQWRTETDMRRSNAESQVFTSCTSVFQTDNKRFIHDDDATTDITETLGSTFTGRTGQQHFGTESETPFIHIGSLSNKKYGGLREEVCLLSASVSLSFLTVVLLHTQPKAPDALSDDALSSVTELCQVAKRHMREVNRLRLDQTDVDAMMGSAGSQEAGFLREVRNQMAGMGPPRDQICLLSRLIHVDFTKNRTSSKEDMNLSLTVHSLEIVETLFDMMMSRGISIPDDPTPKFSELLTFTDSSESCDPCIRVNLDLCTPLDTSQSMPSKSVVRGELGECSIEVDISIVDRLHKLLDKPDEAIGGTGQTLEGMGMSCTVGPDSLPCPSISPIVAPKSSTGRQWETTVIFKSKWTRVKLLFPVVQLSGSSGPYSTHSSHSKHQKPRLAWWRRNLHREWITIGLDKLAFNTKMASHDAETSFEINASELEVLLHSPDFSAPISVLKATGDDQSKLPRVVVCKQPASATFLSPATSPYDSLSSYVDLSALNHPDNTPFASQKTHSEGHATSDYRYQRYHVFSQVTHYPLNTSEMVDYRKKACLYTKLIININLPKAMINLEDKDSLDIIYERLGCDLVLWESLVPKENPLTYDQHGIPLNIYGLPEAQFSGGLSSSPLSMGTSPPYPRPGHPYSMSNQGGPPDSDLEEEPASSGGHNAREREAHLIAKPSSMCLQLDIGQGGLHAYLPSTRSQCGEMLVNFEKACLFYESGHDGQPELSFMTIEADKISLYHSGSSSKDGQSVDFLNGTVPPSLRPTIIPSPSGFKFAFNEGFTDEGMLAVAMEFREKKKPNPTKKGVSPMRQEICLAARLAESCVQYQAEPSDDSWMTQMKAMFDFADPKIEGYLPPECLTTAHCHLNRVVVDYCPDSVPYFGAISCEALTVTSNIHLSSSSSIIQITLDNTGLFVGQDKVAREANLSRSMAKAYVSVAELDHFDLSLAFNGEQGGRLAGVDIRCLNTTLSLHTCADTCNVLFNLITKLCSDQALCESIPAPDSTLSSGMMPTETIPASSQTPGTSSRESSGGKRRTRHRISQSDKRKLTEMLTEAIESDFEQSGDSYTSQESASITTRQSSEDDEYCIIHEAQVPSALDTIDSLLPPEIKNLPYFPDHFRHEVRTHPSPFTDPARYPTPLFSFTLYDASLLWKIYGGNDFIPTASGTTSNQQNIPYQAGSRYSAQTPSTSRSRSSSSCSSDTASPSRPRVRGTPMPAMRFSKAAAQPLSYAPYGSIALSLQPSSLLGSPGKPGVSVMQKMTPQIRQKWCRRGGEDRQTNKSMEFRLCKVNYRMSMFPETSGFAARHLLTIRQFEILDLIDTSSTNKFLSLYSSDSIPYDDKAPMVLFKVLTERKVDMGPKNLESDIKVSVQPLHLNIDQDAINFLENFSERLKNLVFTTIPSSTVDSQSDAPMSIAPLTLPPAPTPSSSYPILSVSITQDEEQADTGEDRDSRDNTPLADETPFEKPLRVTTNDSPSSSSPSEENGSSDSSDTAESLSPKETPEETPVMNTKEKESESPQTFSPQITEEVSAAQMFIRRFIFAPELRVRIDYRGKEINMARGALKGLICGIAQLNNSELVIRKLKYERGFSGPESLIRAIVSDWSADISNNTWGILRGLGPMNELIQILTGIHDLIVCPLEGYQKDGGIMRGFKGGARSFSTCTLWALLELSTQGVRIIQCVAETAYDFVTPGPSMRKCAPKLRPPSNLPEGMNNAAVAVRHGFNRVAADLTRAANRPDKDGIAGTMGEVIRQVGPTIVTPIYIISEVTIQILSGLRSEIRPEPKQEEKKIYKHHKQ